MAKKKPTQSIAATAQKKRYADLLTKLKNGKSLSRAEVKEIEDYENAASLSDKPADWQKVSQQELCAILEVSAVTINKWRKKGMPIRRDGTKIYYSAGAVFKWRLEYQEEQLRSQNEIDGDLSGPATDALDAYRKVKTEEAKFNLEVKRELYIKRDRFEDAMRNAAEYCRSYFQNLGRLLGLKLSKVRKSGEVTKAIDTEVERILRTMVQEFSP